MKRRQFIKSVAATTAVPILPSSLGSALPVSAIQYAKAVEVANKWAYTTAYYLKLALKVDETTSEAVLAQLQTDGILGPKGPSGICLAERINLMKGGSAAKAASEVSRKSAGEANGPSFQQRLAKAAKSETVVEEEPAPEPSDEEDQTELGPDDATDALDETVDATPNPDET